MDNQKTAQAPPVDNIVTLEAGRFRWEAIPEKGRCLVPVRPTVSEDDVVKCRRYRNTKGATIEIVSAYTPLMERFYTVKRLDQNYCYTCSFIEARDMAAQINKASPEGDELAFAEWV